MNKLKELSCYILLFIHYILCCIYEYYMYIPAMNSDIAADLLLAQTMAQNNEWIISNEYIYTTEIHVLHSQLIEQILFRFTNNYRLVFVISFAFWLALVMLVSYLLIKMLTNNKKYAIIGTLLLTGTGGSFYNYFYFTQAFTTYLLFSLIMLYFYLNILKEGEINKRSIAFLVVEGVLSFFMGAGGVRFFTLIIIPLICYEMWSFLFIEKKSINKVTILRVGVILIPALIAYMIFKSPANVNSNIVTGQQVFSSIKSFFVLWCLNSFGPFLYAGDNLLSIKGLTQCYLILITLLIYIIIICYSAKEKNKNSFVKVCLYVFLFTLLSNSFYLFNTALADVDRERYLGIALWLLLPLSIICLFHLSINNSYKKIILILFIVYVGAFDISRVEKVLTSSQQIPEYVVNLENEGYKFGWGTRFWESTNIIGYTNREIEVATYAINEDSAEFYEWGTLKSYKDKEPEFIYCYKDEENYKSILNIREKYNLNKVIYEDWMRIIYGK